MAKVYELRSASDHVVIRGYKHAAVEKGDALIIGGISGLVDHSSGVDADISVDIGVPRAIFQAGIADITGDAAVGGTLYISGANVLTTEAEDNTAFGVVVGVETDVVAVMKL
jgi:hypothetical protein